MLEIPRAADGDFDKIAETNHRVANHLAMLSGIVNLQAAALRRNPDAFDPTQALATFAALEAKLQAVARLHRELAHVERGGVGTIDLSGYLGDIVTTAVESLAAPDTVRLTLALEPGCKVAARDALKIALIASELVTNSIKYAHPSGISGTLRVTCRREQSRLILQIEDDGVGLPADIDPRTDGSVGFRVVRSLAAELEATISFTSDELGLSFTLDMPMRAVATGEVVYLAQAPTGT